MSFPFVHDMPFAELAVEDVMHPIDAYLRTNLITAKAVARHMTARVGNDPDALGGGLPD